MAKCASYKDWCQDLLTAKQGRQWSNLQPVWKPYIVHSVPCRPASSPHILIEQEVYTWHDQSVPKEEKVHKHSDNIYGMIIFMSPLFQLSYTSLMINVNAQEQYFKHNTLHTQTKEK